MKKIALLPFKNGFFIFLFILNLIANFSNYIIDNSTFACLATIGLSGLLSYLESGLCNFFQLKKYKISIFALITLLYNIIIIIEAFMIHKFCMILNQSSLPIIEESSKTDILNFIQTYISLKVIITSIFLLLICNVVIWLVSSLVNKLKYQYIAFVIVLEGFGISAYSCYNYYMYRLGTGIPQYMAITRIVHSYYITRARQSGLNNIIRVCSELEATKNVNPIQNIVLVIGESHSYYHTSFLGYEKDTYPLLSQLDSCHFFIYKNVITSRDFTLQAMQSIYSLNDIDYENYPLFPVCFRKAGYKTILMDNQFDTNNTQFVIKNKKVSDLNFDFRNNIFYTYDEDLISNTPKYEDQNLTILHLNGQHYNYAHKYPKTFTKFSKSNYSAVKYTEKQRELIAAYDNACFYNDYVLNTIIEDHAKEDAIVIYFPDHGEELFECRDYNGHGTAISAPNINYQIHIPMFIWVSDLFMRQHPEQYSRLAKSQNKKISTVNTSHFLLDLAQINVKWLDPSRSFINERYDSLRHRIILNTIDYDK